MNCLILLLIHININFIYLEDKLSGKEIERRVKSLACSILTNTQYAYSIHTKRQIIELLKSNDIIQKEEESNEKIFEFLRAICYKKIEVETANRIIDDISKKRYEILDNEEYGNLFKIESNLNFTKIKNAIKRINIMMKKIEKEEEKWKINETSNQSENKIIKFYRFKTITGIVIALIIISISVFIFGNRTNKIKINEKEKISNNIEKKEEEIDKNQKKKKVQEVMDILNEEVKEEEIDRKQSEKKLKETKDAFNEEMKEENYIIGEFNVKEKKK